MKRFVLITLAFLVALSLASAHQPRIVTSDSSMDDPNIVDFPEVSKAYYSSLDGSPEYFRIFSKEPFILYLNLLTQGRELEYTVSAEVIKDGEVIAVLDGEAAEWEMFYEEYGGDYYMWGPEFEEEVEPGTYYVKVFNENNQGRYSLAVGKDESFPPMEIVNAIFLVPYLKIFFFGKYYLIIALLGVVLAVYIIFSRKR